MREYSNIISLIKNSRGIYCLDTSIGCGSGMAEMQGGCYGDCYAAKSAKLYGYDFGKTVLRQFKNEKHKREIVEQISKIRMPFVRIGCSGDPSENWEHTFNILKVVAKCNKEIIIITRHWTLLSEDKLNLFRKINICINTSVSALDKPEIMNKCIGQYQRIKPYCKSVLRIVSCDFNLNNPIGHSLYKTQVELFKNESTLDTVFRPSKNNQLVTSGIINISTGVFNGHKTTVSKINRKTYTGKCANCREMCGVNISKDILYSEKRGIIKQLSLL
jgi:hypothetical protein